MRLARAGVPGAEIPVVSTGDGWYDLRRLTPDVDGAFLAADGLHRVHEALLAGTLPRVEEPTRFGPPLGRIGKIVCIGLNYVDHAEETGATPPTEPIIFMKAPDTVVGPTDEVLIPRRSAKTDYEVELAIVIGRTARYLDTAEQARGHVAGYAISNDV